MAAVQRWTGLEARALRLALRMSVRAFAEHLGVAARTVSKWERLRSGTEPRPDTQAILDTALGLACAAVHQRFEAHLLPAAPAMPVPHLEADTSGMRAWEYESWTDDLDRAVIALSRQDFPSAERLLQRWLVRFTPAALDDRGVYLFARSTALLGDLRRDRGSLVGPMSASHAYRRARDLFAQLDVPRRTGQLDLLLTLLDEMTGQHDTALRHYARLVTDTRLSERDRARSQLWRGRTLSKAGECDTAVAFMSAAAHDFEDLSEPADWSVAQQKLALARRTSGDLGLALRHMELARSTGSGDSPLQRVRLGAAYGHVLMSDSATRQQGLAELRDAADTAGRYGLGHQLRSIEAIRRVGDETSADAARGAGEVREPGSTGDGARPVGGRRGAGGHR